MSLKKNTCVNKKKRGNKKKKPCIENTMQKQRKALAYDTQQNRQQQRLFNAAIT